MSNLCFEHRWNRRLCTFKEHEKEVALIRDLYKVEGCSNAELIYVACPEPSRVEAIPGVAIITLTSDDLNVAIKVACDTSTAFLLVNPSQQELQRIAYQIKKRGAISSLSAIFCGEEKDLLTPADVVNKVRNWVGLSLLSMIKAIHIGPIANEMPTSGHKQIAAVNPVIVEFQMNDIENQAIDIIGLRKAFIVQFAANFALIPKVADVPHLLESYGGINLAYGRPPVYNKRFLHKAWILPSDLPGQRQTGIRYC